MKRILLWDFPDAIMLIVEHQSHVVYQNQVGGPSCLQAQMGGVLAPIELDPAAEEKIQNCGYHTGRPGITAEIANGIDEVLAAAPASRFVRVDRTRLDESCEAWIHVTIDSPKNDMPDFVGRYPEDAPAILLSYFGTVWGFGTARGVLTWNNSD